MFLALLILALLLAQLGRTVSQPPTHNIRFLVDVELVPVDTLDAPPLHLTFVADRLGRIDPIIELTPMPGAMSNPPPPFFITNFETASPIESRVRTIVTDRWGEVTDISRDDITDEVMTIFETVSDLEFLAPIARTSSALDFNSTQLTPPTRIELPNLKALSAQATVVWLWNR